MGNVDSNADASSTVPPLSKSKPTFPSPANRALISRPSNNFFQGLFLAILIAAQCLAATAGAATYTPPASNHADFNFNYDWLFIKQNVTGGASALNYNESGMQQVSLPHTYNDDKFREWVFNSNMKPADPLRPNGTYYGITWYRKHFTLPAAYAGREIILEFQGITYIGTFYVNGQLVGLNESGFGPSGIDITPYVNFGSDNVIAVKVNNDGNYKTVGYGGAGLPAGQPFNVNYGGINRDVTLHITDKAHLTKPLYRNLGTQGTYIFPTSIDTLAKTATINVQAEVKNDYATAQTITCNSVVVDNTGNVVLSVSGGTQTLAPGATYIFNETGNMTGIHFWDPTFPYLYQVYTTLTINGQVVDVDEVTTGFRTYVFNPTFGLEVNGHPIYLNGYAPRISMEWPAVGTPVDWLNDYDFQMMKASNANFMRPMQCAPHLAQVQAADKYGIVMVVPAAYSENDQTNAEMWQEDLDIMRDNTIYFRNDPSVLFYEACNGEPSAQHMTDMLNIRKTWDPNGGRLAGGRTNDNNVTLGIREYSGSMDGAEDQLETPLFDAEYARAEGPRRVWDEVTPMYNPRWNGVNSNLTPFFGTNTTNKYLTGGYFNIASDYHQAYGFYGASEMVPPTGTSTGGAYGTGDFIGEYLTPIPQTTGSTGAYFRLNSSEDMVLENTAKQYGRYERSIFVQSASTSASKGVNCGGAKIIWSDSVTDGRMHDMEVTRTSGVVDGARLPKEVYYAMQVVQNPNPQVYIVGHWNYPAGTVKTMYVVSNTPTVDLQTYDTAGTLIRDYAGTGTKNFFPTSILPSGGDQVNNYVFAFPNVAWQPGTIKAIGYDSTGKVAATHQKSTAGAPDHIKLTPAVGPSGWMADGSDIAWFDVEVVDANGNRCPTYQDNVTFSCSGAGIFLGGYNSGIRYSTNLAHLTSGYSLQVECGINRVFVRSTRTPGTFTLNVNGVNNVTGTSFPQASAQVASTAVDDTNGLSVISPQKYSPPLGPEPTPVAEGSPPPPVTTNPPAPATNAVGYQYTGGKTGTGVIENVQSGQKAYVDETWTLPALPGYLAGGEYVQPYQSDAGDTSATDQIQFNVTDFSYIYLAIDAANGMPNNDNNATYAWQLMPDTLVLNGRTMNIYRSRIMMPGEIGYFADNGYENTPFDPNSNMYLVFVTNLERQVVKPTDANVASTSQGGNTPAMAIDGNTATRWAATSGSYPQTYTLTLDQAYAIGGCDLTWYSNATRYYQYKIELSNDGVNYNLSLDQTANTAMGDYQYRVPALNAMVGKYVRITITGASGGYASIYEININGIPAGMVAPAVAAGPSPQGVAAGQSLTLSVSPTGISPFTYQWMLNGNAISGGTNSTYTIASASAGDTGNYTVLVTDAAGSGTFNVSNVTLTPDVPTLPIWASLALFLVLFIIGHNTLLRKRPASDE